MMPMHVQDSKAAIRQQVRVRLNVLNSEQHTTASEQVCLRLEQQQLWKDACSILLFASLPKELDIWRLVGDAIAVGKLVALPRFDSASGEYAAGHVRNLKEDIVCGRFGIREPHRHCETVPLNRLDLILVPGVAFDLHGRRLGRGKGFYDQLLARVRGTTCGVAFDEQIVAEIPVEPHDVVLNCILTPTRWIQP